MSTAQILIGVRDYLRTEMPVSPRMCDIEPDLYPRTTAPQWYISLDEGDVTTNGKREFLEEEYSIDVGVWHRTGEYSDDNWSNIYLKHSTGLDANERKVIKAIHRSYELMNQINALGAYGWDDAKDPARPPDKGDIVQLPLFYAGRSKTMSATLPIDNSQELSTWLWRKLHFGGMLRVQAIDIMR